MIGDIVRRSHICGVTCTTGSPECNGYCTNGSIPAPSTYDLEMMGIGGAILAMKNGEKVARLGWAGKGLFVYYVPPASYPVQSAAAKAHFGEGALVPYNAYLALKGADGAVSTWAPSCSDALAEDWHIVP